MSHHINPSAMDGIGVCYSFPSLTPVVSILQNKKTRAAHTLLRPQCRLKIIFRNWLAMLFLMPLLGFAAPPERFSILHAFNGSDGSNPRASLLRGGAGNFYGTTYRGGRGDGTVFKLTPSGMLVSLHEFNGADGSLPSGKLVMQSAAVRFRHGKSVCDSEDVNEQDDRSTAISKHSRHHCDRTGAFFFGTTETGGSGSAGTVFKITASGVLTSLYHFSGSDGSAPNGLVQGSDNNFYGTTQSGGPVGSGTIFKITADGVFTTLYAFNGSDGATPRAALVQGDDGNFYGTTEFGGAANSGTVFKITPAGALTTLHVFSFGADGALPLAALVQGRDGNFFGTTYQGARGYGTVFKMTPDGTLTTLHAFYPNDGEGGHPLAELIQAEDRSYYGTTEAGGTHGLGTVFKITAVGELTTLHMFNGSDGSNPAAGLVQGKINAFYGTTSDGGPYGSGVIFKIPFSRPVKSNRP